MRGLLGDRFLRRFTGDLKQRQKHRDFTSEEQNPETELDAASGSEAVGPIVCTSEKDHEEADAGAASADSASIGVNDVPSKTEPTKHNENEPKAD